MTFCIRPLIFIGCVYVLIVTSFLPSENYDVQAFLSNNEEDVRVVGSELKPALAFVKKYSKSIVVTKVQALARDCKALLRNKINASLVLP